MVIGNVKDRNAFHLKRRTVLKNAALGSSALIGTQHLSGQSRAAQPSAQREAREITDESARSDLLSIVKGSTAYETYIGHFDQQDHLTFKTEASKVYKIVENGTTTKYGVSFGLTGQADTILSNSGATFHVENRSIQDSAAFVLKKQNQTTVKGTKYYIEDGALSSDSLTMTRSASGDVQVVDRGYSAQFSFGCNNCKGVMKALCQVGCAANAGVVCTIATGGLGAVACGVLAGLICSYIVVPADCTAQDEYRHKQLCKKAGFC